MRFSRQSRITNAGGNTSDIHFWDVRQQSEWERLSQRERASWLLQQLEHCTDVLPDWVRTEFEHLDDDGVARQPGYAELASYLAKETKL
jgi:hypothetical protein